MLHCMLYYKVKPVFEVVKGETSKTRNRTNVTKQKNNLPIPCSMDRCTLYVYSPEVRTQCDPHRDKYIYKYNERNV